MIYLRDATALAYTKLKTRRVRLAVSLLVVSLLFSILFAASMVFRGFSNSYSQFSEEGYSNRFFVAGEDISMINGMDQSDAEFIALARSEHKKVIDEKTAAAKELGISYDPKSEPPAVHEENGMTYVDQTTLAGQRATEILLKKNPKPDADDFRRQLAGLDITDVYRSKSPPFSGTSSLAILQDGKERKEQGSSMPFGSFENFGMNWRLTDKTLMQPFLLQNQNTELGKDNSVPVIVPFSAAREAIGMAQLPLSATPAEKLEQLKEVRAQAAGKLIQVCYRNGASASLLSQAESMQAEIKNRKDDEDYLKPELIYAPHKQPCRNPVVASDTRSAENKAYAEKQARFEERFGAEKPHAEVIELRIVGISADMPGMDGNTGMTADMILSMIGGSTTSGQWLTPIDMESSQPLLKKIFSSSSVDFRMDAYIAELANATSATEALGRSCSPDYMSYDSQIESIKKCQENGQLFMIHSYGSASLALDEFQKTFRQVLLWAAGGFALIAGFILMGVVGRIIADARRETAVFRAVGASRFDIIQIYVTYTLFVMLLALGLAMAIGASLALWVNANFTDDFSVAAALAFGVKDLTKQFHLVGFDLVDILIIGGIMMGAGLLAALLPILSNARRSPMTDMRDES